MRALAFDLGADVGELAFQVGGRLQLGERRFRRRARRPSVSSRLADQAGLGLGERRDARGVARPFRARPWRAARAALSASRCASRQCSRASAFGGDRRGQLGLRRFGGLALVVERRARA